MEEADRDGPDALGYKGYDKKKIKPTNRLLKYIV